MRCAVQGYYIRIPLITHMHTCHIKYTNELYDDYRLDKLIIYGSIKGRLYLWFIGGIYIYRSYQ